MPEISRFYGLIIFMNYNEHDPPHFHVRYQDREIIVEIKTGIVEGKMSKRALRMVFEWHEKHIDELMMNWDLAKERKPLKKIEPLVWENIMFLHVIEVRYLSDYKLRLKFNDGVIKDVDLKDELYGEVFNPLKDIEMFKKVKVNQDTNTIEWETGADFAPEFLYKIGKEVKKIA